MKPALQAAAVFLLGCLPLVALPGSKLAAEWHVPATDVPGMFALVDEAEGTARIAVMDKDGTVAWPHNVPTGITGVSDVTTGIHSVSGEMLAVTSPDSNRVVLVELESFTPHARILSEKTGIGSSGVVSMGKEGTRQLMVASSQNGAVSGRFESLTDPGGDPEVTSATNASDFLPRRLQPVSVPGDGIAISLFTEGGPDQPTRVGLANPRSNVIQYAVAETLPEMAEVATGVVSLSQMETPFAIGYQIGRVRATLLLIGTPLIYDSPMSAFSIRFPFPPAAIIPVPLGAHDPLVEGFLVVAEDGSEARFMRIDSSGENIEDAGHTFTAEPGAALSGLAVVPGHGIVKLHAPAPGMPSTTYSAYQWDGGSWIETDSGAIPAPDEATASSAAALMYFDAHPLLAPRARLLGVQAVRDWTSLEFYYDGLPASVMRENFASPEKGLVPADMIPLTPPPGTEFVVVNQAEPGVSITALGALDAIIAPQLTVDPPSGTYPETLQVTANFEDDRYRLRYRRDGGDWLVFHTAVPVAWTTTLQFTLEDLDTGERGPIVTREYTLPPEDIANLDSNGDLVPDYVGAYFGLDPFGGADSNGNGFSDLDEILQGTNPADPTDRPAQSLGIAIGGGLSLVASAIDHADREIATRQDITARRNDGTLLARAQVIDHDDPILPDGTTYGALLEARDAPPFRELIAVSTPVYFNTANTGARSGREIIAHIPSDPPPAFEPDFTPTSSMTLEQAAQGWIAAAIDAAANHAPATDLTLLEPTDSAVSVLLEHIAHAALAHVRPGDNPAPPLDRFTFFPGRDADAALESADSADRRLLRNGGFDKRLALALAEDAAADMSAAATSIYQRHSAQSAGNPGMPLPMDALRTMLRGGSAPDGYAGAVSSAALAAARAAYAAAVADFAAAFRPFDTWVITIPESPLQSGVHLRDADDAEVVLLRPSGERFLLDQGLGLRPGSRFTVAGFTDTAPVGGRDSMEVTTASLTFEPAPSDNDQDGNLLDDEWEEFFFGSTGQDAYSEPHGNGYTLLQYFLTGTDPRGGQLPSGPPVDLRPQLPIFESAGDGGFTLDFVFPAEFSDQFAFILERSATLKPGGFTEVPGIQVQHIGNDEFRATIPEHEAPPGRAFFRIRLALK